MHAVLQDSTRTLLSLSQNELEALKRAVDAAIRASSVSDTDFEHQFGSTRDGMRTLHAALGTAPHASRQVSERIDAWEDQGAVMLLVMNTWGDPVELGETEAAEFRATLDRAVREASGESDSPRA